MNQTCDLRTISIGAKFTRYWFGKYGVYTVIGKPHGSYTVEVQTQDGKRGELPAWERVIEVK